MKYYNIERKYNLTKINVTKDDKDEIIIDSNSTIPSFSGYIDYMWITDEDGIAIYKDKKYEVKANQLIILCYPINPEGDSTVYIIDMPDSLLEFVRAKEEWERQRASECKSCCDCACEKPSC